MPRRGAGRAWQRLPNEAVASLKEARALMKCFDLGAGGLWKWPSSGGGDGVTVSVLQCNAHVHGMWGARSDGAAVERLLCIRVVGGTQL